MKIWPTSVLKRAAQLFISNIVGIATFAIFSVAIFLLSYSRNFIPGVSGFNSVLLELMIFFVSGLYVSPAISRLFIRYLLLRSSGDTLTKQILYQQIKANNVVRFMVLTVIVSTPYVTVPYMIYFFIKASSYMMWLCVLAILVLVYLYSRIFIAQIVMVDRTATIDQSLKQAVAISKEYPLNSLFFAVVILALYSLNIPYVQFLLLAKIHISISMLIWSGIKAMTEVLTYVISTGLYIEVKRRKNLHV